jgi:hypothetical protein
MFHNLDSIQRSTFTEIVAHNPHAQKVWPQQGLSDPTNQYIVCTSHI